MRGIVHINAGRSTPGDPQVARLAAVSSGYHRVLAGAVDKVVQYRISPDVLTAVALGSARGIDTVASLGWRTLTVIALTVLMTVTRVRRAQRKRQNNLRGHAGTSCGRPSPRAITLRRHPRRPPGRPLQPLTSRRPSGAGRRSPTARQTSAAAFDAHTPRAAGRRAIVLLTALPDRSHGGDCPSLILGTPSEPCGCASSR